MKKLIENMIDISFVISLTLLGKFDLDIFELSKYQIIVTVYCVSGLLKYKNPKISIKESIVDSLKDLTISIAIVPLWYWISNNVETDFFEPISVLGHYVSLMIILYIAKKEEKSIGPIAYYTYATIPIITLIFIQLGISVNFSLIIAIIIIIIINWFFYKKKNNIR